MKYELIFESEGVKVKQGRVLFQNDPVFTTIVENHKKAEWRFPEKNHVSSDTITCHYCQDVLVEVIKKDEEGKDIEDYRNYPVYIKVHEYFSSHYKNSGVCVPCWEDEQKTLKEEEAERTKRRIARNEKQKSKRAETESALS